MMRLSRLGILVFVISVVAAPLYTAAEYSSVKDRISEIAAQQAPNAWVMAFAFICCGCTIVFDGLRMLRPREIPFVAFGVCFILLGIFPSEPSNPTLPIDEVANQLHGLMGVFSGFALTVGFLLSSFAKRGAASRRLDAGIALLCVLMPLGMLAWPNVEGLIQRSMYAIVFCWIWVNYPRNENYLPSRQIPKTQQYGSP